MNDPILSAEKLELRLDNFSLKVKSFCLRKNEKCVITGPNGSGKSTFSKILSGYLLQDGCVKIAGKDIKALSPEKRASLINYASFDGKKIAFEKTVEDFIMLGAYLRKSSDSTVESDKEKLLQIFDLNKLKKRKVTNLSSGEFQRVLLAQTLIQNSTITILDEPLNHLDFSWQSKILDLIFEYAAEKEMTILTVIHDLNIALNMFERLIAFNSGKIVCDEDLLSIEQKREVLMKLEKAYDTEFKFLEKDGNLIIIPF